MRLWSSAQRLHLVLMLWGARLHVMEVLFHAQVAMHGCTSVSLHPFHHRFVPARAPARQPAIIPAHCRLQPQDSSATSAPAPHRDTHAHQKKPCAWTSKWADRPACATMPCTATFDLRQRAIRLLAVDAAPPRPAARESQGQPRRRVASQAHCACDRRSSTLRQG